MSDFNYDECQAHSVHADGIGGYWCENCHSDYSVPGTDDFTFLDRVVVCSCGALGMKEK